MALAPVYLACLGWLAARLNAGYGHASTPGARLAPPLQPPRRSALWPALWLGASVACLVPSPLLELRYFTVPWLVAHAHAAPYLLPRLESEEPPGLELLPASEPQRGGAGSTGPTAAGSTPAGSTIAEAHTFATKPARRREADAWPSGMGSAACLGAGFLAVDAALLYVFLAKPFAWPDGSTARFMW